MKRTRLSFHIFAISTILILSTSVISPSFAFAEKTKPQNDNCKAKYNLYREIGESKFKEKYQKKPKILDCLNLYKNSNWDFAGKGKIDQRFDSSNSNVKINILLKNSIGQQKYVLKFEACSKQSITKPYFLIKSDSDKYLTFPDVNLQSSKCSTFRSEINAASPSTIQIEYVNDPGRYENLKTKRLSLV
ncbi:MAG: hypothetical protein QXN55_05325 [Candidatus Nitrosotenuis sp.]